MKRKTTKKSDPPYGAIRNDLRQTLELCRGVATAEDLKKMCPFLRIESCVAHGWLVEHHEADRVMGFRAGPTLECEFCCPRERWIQISGSGCVAFFDPPPMARALVVPCRHVPSIFNLNAVEQAHIWELVARARSQLLSNCQLNECEVITIDCSTATGTSGHAHIQIIPCRR